MIVRSRKDRLKAIMRQPALSSPDFLLGKFSQMVDEAKADLFQSLQRQVQEKKLKLLGLQRQARAQNPLNRLAHLKQKLSMTASHLRSINPKNLLTKGYAIVFDEKQNSVILSAKKVKENEALRILMHDGTIEAHVK